ncbi:MAG: FAD-dependent oxidoreductase [Prosthecobacter sp.]
MNRRRFLHTTTAAMSAGALSGCGRHGSIPGSIVGGSHQRGHQLRDLASLPGAGAKVKRCDVLVIGGGIAGLSAARRLAQLGIEKITVLELEADVGGASIAGRNTVSAYPWGAHYLPLPGKECAEVLQFLEEIKVITGHDAAGRPIYDELALCHDPHERLFIHGEWVEGLVPEAGLTKSEREQFETFKNEIQRWQNHRGSDGKPAFTLPVDLSSQDADILALDQQTMAAWMQSHGFTCEPLRWHVDYCVRDDFGGSIDQISAWAGIHYFASRSGEAANAERDTVLTWPQGNGFLVEKLRGHGGFEVITGRVALNVSPQRDCVRVTTVHDQEGVSVFEARAVLLATPRFISRRLLDPRVASPDLTYSPWVVANITLDELPPSPGVLPAWDNVVFGGPSLGYVNATHQNLSAVPSETVITHYEALCVQPTTQTREWMLTQSHAQWCARVFSSLLAPHPDLIDHVQSMDVWLWGHGMIRPTPGFIWGDTRLAMTAQTQPVFHAHSDMSGMSLFEEAYTRGVNVAAEMKRWLDK